MDDSELLRQYVQGGSEAAFTELVNRHLDVVFSAACRQVGDVHRARDVAQGVFTDLARKAPGLLGHTALVGWLYTSTHFAAAKVRRNEQRRAEREQEAHAMNELLSSPEDQADWERLRPVIDEAMHELKPRDRAAVLLRFFEQRTFAEVGRHLGLGENAARMSVERALEKLGGLLARRGITSSAAALSLALTSQAVAAAPAGLATAVASGALGQAALAGSAGLGTLLATFMANTKLTLGVAALAGLLALGTGIVTETRGARATAELAGVTQETAALTARAQEIEKRLAAQAAAQSAPAAVEVVATPPPAVNSAEAKRDEFMRAVLKDPQSTQLFAQLYRVDARRKYAALYGQLGWTAAQIEQFETIFEASTAEDLRSQGGAEVKGTALTLTPEIAAQLERIRGEFENRLRATFGEATLQQFLMFEHTNATRAVTEDVARRVYLTATPLTAAQADELGRILGANSPASETWSTVPYRAVNWDQVLAQAQGVLAPAQLRALRALRLRAEFDAKRSAVLFPEAKP
jgi:RNA polymerase sigma factor (sigma-70 family)